MKARGVGEMMARVGACGASVVTSSAEREGMSRGRKKQRRVLTSGLGIASA